MSNYIKVEDVQKILEDSESLYFAKDLKEFVKNNISNLPSINPELMIEEMIKDRYKINEEQKTHYELQFEISVLEKLLQKFKS